MAARKQGTQSRDASTAESYKAFRENLELSLEGKQAFDRFYDMLEGRPVDEQRRRERAARYAEMFDRHPLKEYFGLVVSELGEIMLDSHR